jgi:hypothetical protein
MDVLGWFSAGHGLHVQFGVVLHFVETAIQKQLPPGLNPTIRTWLLINDHACSSDEMLTEQPSVAEPGTYKACQRCPQQLACVNGSIQLDARAKVSFSHHPDKLDFTIREKEDRA